MDSVNTQTTYEQEVDLKDLIFAILRKWRIILTISVLFAVLLGGAKGFLTYRAQSNPESISQQEEAYQASLKQYEAELASYEREIENISDSIISQQEYMENSVLMNLSPYDVCEARGDLFIKTDYEIMPGMIYQNVNYTDSILQAYQYIITSASFLEGLKLPSKIEIPYLQELISVERGRLDSSQGEVFANSPSGISALTNLLSIRVRHANLEDAEKILNAILDQLDQVHRQIAKDIGDHSVTVLNTSSGSSVNLDLANRQNEETARLDALRTSLTDKETAMKEISKPNAVTSSNAAAAKTAIKYAVLGGVLGGFITVFFICVCFLLSDKLYAPKELRNRFGAKILGTLPVAEQASKNFIDLWINRLEGRIDKNSSDNQYELIAANIKNHMDNIKILLVSGCAASDSIAQVTDYLREHLPNVQVVTGGNLLQNVDAVQKLSACDSVVLVEQCNYSSYPSIELELEKICDLKKEITGFIVFE